MFETDLLKVKVPQALAVVLFLQGSLVAPMWFIFQFQPLLFNSTDLLKLVFISLAVGVPVHLFNAFLLATKAMHDIFIAIKGDWTIGVAAMSCLTLLTFYSPCIVAFFRPLTFRQAAWTSTGVQLFFTLIVWLVAQAVKAKNLRISQEAKP